MKTFRTALANSPKYLQIVFNTLFILHRKDLAHKKKINWASHMNFAKTVRKLTHGYAEI